MAHSKPLFIQWLRAQIDSGAYPGVQWTNQEQTEFCIPWKHALRQDSSDSDILIFKAWAKVSGNGRIQGEASVWKRNFRCALRAKKFQMIADNKNDTANPHKVYRWPDESTAGENSSATPPSQYEPDCHESPPIQESYVDPFVDECLYCPIQESSPSEDLLQTCLKQLNIGPQAEEAAAFEFPPEQQERRHPIVIGGHMLPWQQPHPVAAEDEVGGAGSPGQPAHPMEGAVGEACGGQLAKQFLDNIHKTKDGNHFKTEFRIIVHYRGQKVSEQLVANEAGFRLIYRPEQAEPALDQESGLSLVSLPSPVTIKDQKQAKLTQCILDKLGEGLDVGVSGDVVYGQRRGEIKAFWSFSKFDHSGRPQEISKQQPQPLYPFRDFIHGILDFITLESKECGPCSLFLCLGEKWPDPQNWPWTKKLIIVEVVLTSLELLKNMAMEGGASSLKSVDLQVSLEEMVIG
ncbi:interferon regulatory factor 3 [Hippocampus comes]|uniref:interferon regulatory factor 3 n=1 Tax=Hippocampus comes TaxID=109280 RepID=UPI00094EC1AB|nr:PREDICTED: interferon regulatory factor 3-like [Hippocampus comes]XP_019739085.1 PREDICTED: interferon regulatory factor 3-like [Hippocampus comes]XP_019739086.1 PREDICTED: interferon regulatory factor 3-like [Hippocampus comes]